MLQSTKPSSVNPSGLIHPTNLLTFGSAISRPEALKTMPVSNLMAMIQNGNWRKQIEALRRESNPALRKELKLRLPYFVYGIVEHKREDANVRQINGIAFDVDSLGSKIASIKACVENGMLPAVSTFADLTESF